MQRRPQVEDVALLSALLGEALEDVGFQVDAEGAAAAVAAMQRTRTAALWTLATQTRQQTQLIEYLAQRQLRLDVGKIHKDALANFRCLGYPVVTGRGDHLLRRRCFRLVARGLASY